MGIRITKTETIPPPKQNCPSDAYLNGEYWVAQTHNANYVQEHWWQPSENEKRSMEANPHKRWWYNAHKACYEMIEDS